MKVKLKPSFSSGRKRYFDFMLYIFYSTSKNFSADIWTTIGRDFRKSGSRESRIFTLQVSYIYLTLFCETLGQFESKKWLDYIFLLRHEDFYCTFSLFGLLILNI